MRGDVDGYVNEYHPASIAKQERAREIAERDDVRQGVTQTLEGFRDDTASSRSYGLDVVTRLCDDLLRAGAPGLHFYTLNQAGLTSTIWQRLGL